MTVLPHPAQCVLLVLLAPGRVTAEGRIKITTTVNAHYAITTVKAPFTTGDAGEDVTFEMTMVPEAFVSKFSITTDGLECKANVEELDKAEEIFGDCTGDLDNTCGITKLSNSRASQEFTTTVFVKGNTEGFFLLTYEHQVQKDEEDARKPYKLVIPVSTRKHYDRWTVIMDITEDQDFAVMEQDIKFEINEEEDVSGNFKATVRPKRDNKKTFVYDGTVREADVFTGNFSLKYTTDLGTNQMEVFVSETQGAAVISPNFGSTPGMELVVVLDTSGSMKNGKLDQTVGAVLETILKKPKEEDRITFIQFSTEVKNLGTYSGTTKDRRNIKKLLAKIEANGYTNINGAINEALEVSEKRIQEGSSVNNPLIMMYTDGKPEGGKDKTIVTDTAKIRGSIKGRNSRCIPIYSIAIGDGSDFNFVKDLSEDSCGGRAYDLKTNTSLTKDLEAIFKEVRVPILASKPEISVRSECVEETALKNDLTALKGQKFANTSNFDMISFPFKTSFPDNTACEVQIVYTATVGNKPVEETIKLCFPYGRKSGKKFLQLTNLTEPCPDRIRGLTNTIPKGDFLERLRLYREITDSANNNGGDKDTLVRRAKEANFVVEGHTALIVVVEADNDQCTQVNSSHRFVAEKEPVKDVSEYTDSEIHSANCIMIACDKSNFRGHCITIYDGVFNHLRTSGKPNEKFFGLGPDEIASMRISHGPGSKESCLGYILYMEEEFQGDSRKFVPNEYKGFREMKGFFQETRSLRIVS